jgi:RNA polymerase sigma factor (sigma-70 family)
VASGGDDGWVIPTVIAKVVCMSSGDSVTHWVEQLKGGDHDAAAKLWHRYYARLVRLAHAKLRAAPRRVADEDDVVQNAFASFVRRAQQGKFPRLQNRDELWALLIAITQRKAANQLRDQNRQKRGGGKVSGDSACLGADKSTSRRGIDQVADAEPTPEFAALMTERFRELLHLLDDDELRRIALLKLENYTNQEIAVKIKRSEPTVERRLRLIRAIWKRENSI